MTTVVPVTYLPSAAKSISRSHHHPSSPTPIPPDDIWTDHAPPSYNRDDDGKPRADDAALRESPLPQGEGEGALVGKPYRQTNQDTLPAWGDRPWTNRLSTGT